MRLTPLQFVRLALTSMALMLGVAHAELCRQELTLALMDQTLERAPTGVDAARALRRAVELVEPALPPLRTDSAVPLAENHPDYAAVRYLADRRLLPETWQPESIDGATWERMLNAFLAWYKLPGVSPGAPGTAGELIADMDAVLERVSGAIRPAALLATDPANGNRISFWAIIWNWTVYPRLLVVRPTGDPLTHPSDVLPRLSNCAVKVEAYISAPEETAKSIFLTHNSSRMYVVASSPGRERLWPYQVPAGEELDAFVYRHPEVDGLWIYSAVFDGPSVGIGSLLGLMTRVRTNVSPFNINRYLQTP